VGELAQRRAAIAQQREDVEHELGDILITAQDVIDIVRESLRREALDALSTMIRTVDHDLEQMLILLEQADP
jgi:hypothetical protein